MGNATFVFKKVETFPLTVEIDCELGKGKLTLDCKPKSRPDIDAILEQQGATVSVLFDEVVTAVRGAGGADGNELTGAEAIEWFKNGPVSAYTMPAFFGAYLDHFGDARRKNGQRLPRR